MSEALKRIYVGARTFDDDSVEIVGVFGGWSRNAILPTDLEYMLASDHDRIVAELREELRQINEALERVYEQRDALREQLADANSWRALAGCSSFAEMHETIGLLADCQAEQQRLQEWNAALARQADEARARVVELEDALVAAGLPVPARPKS